MEGDHGRAIDFYVHVAQRFADLEIAEEALMTAARMAECIGDRSRARALLRSYLARFSDGRRCELARGRLQRLAELRDATPSAAVG